MDMSGDNVTAWLTAWGKGDGAADDRLIAAVYTDLRQVARRRLQAERAGHSLSPTALVHETYLRLVDLRRIRWRNRVQFFAIAARVMRRVLVDHARAHGAVKRGAAPCRVPLTERMGVTVPREADVLDLEAALHKLDAIDPYLSELVVLRFFGGLTLEETAEALRSSQATIKRDWTRARAWLFRELRHSHKRSGRE